MLSAEQRIEALEAIELSKKQLYPLFPTILDHNMYIAVNIPAVLVSTDLGATWKESKNQRSFGGVNFTPEVLEFIDNEI